MTCRGTAILACVALLLVPAWGTKIKIKRATPAAEVRPPDLLLEGGRKLTFERSFRSEQEARRKFREEERRERFAENLRMMFPETFTAQAA